MANILVVDDSEDLLEMLTIVFKMKGHQVVSAKDIVDTVKSINVFSPDIILLDVSLGSSSGKELCKEIKIFYPGIPIVLMSGNPDLLKDYKEYKADGSIEKPFDVVTLNNKINALLAGKNIQAVG